jgi:hypothetical protein
MPSYKPLRSSSPTRDRQLEDGESHELVEDKRQSTDAEQNEQLLPKDDDDEEEDVPRHRLHRLRVLLDSEPCRVILVGLLTVLALVVIFGIGYFVRAFLHGKTSGDTSSDFRRSSADYVLDPAWDYGAAAQIRQYDWVLDIVDANPDGVFRPVITINGKFPGEMIRANEGDTIVVNVENRMVNATSIHWHGIFQNGTNWMDGAPGVTQCPIAPGGRFRYEFLVKGQAGSCECCHKIGPDEAMAPRSIEIR